MPCCFWSLCWCSFEDCKVFHLHIYQFGDHCHFGDNVLHFFWGGPSWPGLDGWLLFKSHEGPMNSSSYAHHVTSLVTFLCTTNIFSCTSRFTRKNEASKTKFGINMAYVEGSGHGKKLAVNLSVQRAIFAGLACKKSILWFGIVYVTSQSKRLVWGKTQTLYTDFDCNSLISLMTPDLPQPELPQIIGSSHWNPWPYAYRRSIPSCAKHWSNSSMTRESGRANLLSQEARHPNNGKKPDEKQTLAHAVL